MRNEDVISAWEERWLDPDYDFCSSRDDEWEWDRADDEYAERCAERMMNDGK